MKKQNDMEHKKKGIRSSLRKANSIVHTLRNLYDRSTDNDFREFQIMEYDAMKVAEISDVKRLTYLKKMQLANTGEVDTDLKGLLAQQKQKQRFIDTDAKITPVGLLKIIDGEVLRTELQLGYEPEDQTFSIAYADYEGIPKWKRLDMEEFGQFIARIHPNASDHLRLEHAYSANNINDVHQSMDLNHLQGSYNLCVSKAFHANKYFGKSVLSPDENLLENPELYLGKQFRLSLSGKQPTIATLSEANGHYLSFQSFLQSAPKPETSYFTIAEFKRMFLDSKIELVALLKFNLRLGVKEGILQIGRNADEPPHSTIEWERYDSIIKTSELPMKVKYYLCKEVIMKKNFVVEKDAILLKSQSKKAFFKKHYKTGKWHFAEGKKPCDELHFRPINPEISNYIRQQYQESKDFETVEKQVLITKTTIYQMRQ